ncbi:MAG: glycoside hydrolase family 9 protein [Fibrobacter sp.]|nr:glycoside hydrolase family 9 protein [Fibrobacter sp.]
MTIKKTLLAGLAAFGLAAVDASAALSEDDFVEAAWMTTRFFGAQRSGEGPNWMADGTNYPTSFMKDSYQGKDITGGWFDCGDHVMFGQTQGFAAYILALSYAEFTEGFYDLYTGDYTDYKASNDYSRKGGKPNKIRDLLEELRYEADFWVKAAPDEKTFVAVKGDGNYDHMKWVTPGKMSTLGTGEGGGNRPVQANTNDSFSSGMVAAMMAVMARVDPDEANRTKYLQAAKNAYAYAKAHKGVTTSGSFYAESWWDGRVQDGVFLGALELYRTTKDESYKSDAQKVFADLKFEKGSYSRLNYANAVPLSVVMAQGVFDWTPEGGTYRDMQLYLDNIYKGNMKDDIFMKETGGGGSFSVRTPSGGAFLYALYAKFTGDTDYDQLIEKNVAYLLGDNGNKKSYIVGFDRNSAKAPTAPHHRGYYGNEDEGREVGSFSANSAPAKNKYFGAMIAGSFNNPGHNTNVSDWQENEVCVDMNAPMVGALGYILSKKAPKTDVDLGIKAPETPKDTVSSVDPNEGNEAGILSQKLVASGFSLVRSAGVVSVANAAKSAFAVSVFDLNGNMVQRIESDGQPVYFVPKSKGVFHVRVSSNSQQKVFTLKNF